MEPHFLINSFFRGGAEKQTAGLLRHLPHRSVFLLENEIDLTVGLPGIKPLSGHTSATCPVFKTFYIPLYAKKLAAQVERNDTVVSFMERANFVNILAARRTGHRTVICERTQPSREFSGARGMAMRPLIKRLYPEAGLIIANSNGVKLDLVENFSIPGEKIAVIHNGYETVEIAVKAKEELEPEFREIFSRPVLITSGRLTAAKGQWNLLEIFAGVKKRKPETALVFLGDGELKNHLISFSTKLGLRTFSGEKGPPPEGNIDVYFLGFRENPYKFLSRAKIFVFTSIWEGFPNSVVEALTAGLPVVSADCASGPREILAPGTDFASKAARPEFAEYGVLMPPFRTGEKPGDGLSEAERTIWSETLLKLLDDPDGTSVYSGKAARRAADFDIHAATAKWNKLLTTR